MRFKTFIENEDHSKELQQIWTDTFKALGVGGLSDEDAAQQSLSRITLGQRDQSNKPSVFKGKQAVSKRLENAQIFSRLERISDPELRQTVEQTRRWLDSRDDKGQGANGSTTVSNLLKMLFGDKYFTQFIDKDFPKNDPKAAVEPQPPKQVPGSMTQPPPVMGQQGAPPPTGGPMGSQPQVPNM